MFYLHLCYSRESRYPQRSVIDIQVAAIQRTVATYEEGQRTMNAKLRKVILWCYYEWGEEGIVQKPPRLLATATATTTTTRMRMTITRLDAERKPHETRTAVQWKREAINTDPELESSKFCFDFRRFYLHLCYSMEHEALQGINEASCCETSTKDVDLVVGGSSSVGCHSGRGGSRETGT
ncbi:hypothetical protein M404DRAFT_1008474 [Pisolithus tinctorius Marx 270]|uniref:Uncharacterized protein n=1 Tax=Pisolithus tinctorius Marx 270 TaxID=870435 RepID=A0A0C3J9D8_PISTI|nr:hypothetical protein M404DRAFT_1008474 [Pisolithus tinctorius Marx 270]